MRGRLRQLRHIKREIALLEEQIADIDGMGLPVVTDKVKGSLDEHPFIEREFVIRGYDQGEYERKVERLKRQLQRRHDDLIDMVAEVNEYIERIDDSLIRQIIALRHINGLTWEQVAAHIGGGTTWDSLRKMYDRYLEGQR